MYGFDLAAEQYIEAFRSPLATQYLYILTVFFDVTLASVLLYLFTVWLIALVRGRRYAALFLLAMLAGAAVSYILKIYFNVARPPYPLAVVFGPSFPSYHATIVSVFSIMLIYIFDSVLKGILRVVFNILAVLLVLAVGFSRVYLGAHWLSDVAAGILLGATISFLVITVFRKIYSQKLSNVL